MVRARTSRLCGHCVFVAVAECETNVLVDETTVAKFLTKRSCVMCADNLSSMGTKECATIATRRASIDTRLTCRVTCSSNDRTRYR